MNYRRVLLLTELGGDARLAVAMIRKVAPAAELLLVVAHVAKRKSAWFSDEAPGDLDEAVTVSVDALRRSTAGGAKRVEVTLVPDLDVGAMSEIAAASEIDLVVAGSLPLYVIAALAELRKRRSVAVLWTARAPLSDRPMRDIVCVAVGSRARAAVAAFLRDHGNSTLHATIVLLDSQVRDREAALGIAGIEARVDLVTPAAPRKGAIDLLVLPRFPGVLLGAHSWPAPILILPPLYAVAPVLKRAIDVADLVDDGGVVRASIHYAGGIGRYDPIPDQQVAFVSAGRIAAVITTSNGEGELPADLAAESFGVFRVGQGTASDPVSAIEQTVTVIRPGSRPLLLFGSEVADRDLALLAGLSGQRRHELLAVRMRPTRNCNSIRARLRAAGLSTRVVDASAVLDEGAALDVPEAVDPVRLARVGTRMRAAGFPVAAIVHCGPHTPLTIGFAALRAEEIAATPLKLDAVAPQTPSLASRLEATNGAPLLPGNRIEIEMDNAKARRWLLEAIAASRQRVHLQLYMALDDDIGGPVEAALAEAGARGVTVRVVVDSLHGLEGSFGVHNPLLERLAARPGVELLVSRPVTGVPSLEDVKQRDHRKLAVIDGALGLLGGRNLSHEYYTGFDEVKLTPSSTWRQVPWLDAGARVEGPAVAALERSFLDAWTPAGGSPFEIVEQPVAGSAAARVVVHHGLRDACSLEAYLALIETATSHVYVVNGFPLILEIQHALLRAIGRGVRVRTLFGNLTPTHGGKPFGGPWSTARVAATEMVHSRMDAVVAAGGEGYQFAVREQPGWSEGLGVVNPHVHAKVMSVDGRVCSVGSANLDITAGYWEHELMLIVEDESITRALETRIDQLIGGSQAVDRNDPTWQLTARRRNWLRHWPGVLSV
ncbi:MAG: phosphatidylserine/phosphatidylglycerophosphate/cardiolipin synthase family protein [Thermoanaerobaculales bacterium]